MRSHSRWGSIGVVGVRYAFSRLALMAAAKAFLASGRAAWLMEVRGGERARVERGRREWWTQGEGVMNERDW